MGQSQTILFAGGGTGGHIFPSLAIVEQLRLHAIADRPAVHFACSDRPLDAQLLAANGQSFTPLPVVAMPRSVVGLPGFLLRLNRSIQICKELIRHKRISTVVAMGGFVCGPVVLAAKKLGVPCMLVNLDAVAGKANRRLARRCQRVLSVHDLPALASKVEVVGFPLRQVAIASMTQAQARAELGLEPALATLLVTGASQGAKSINEALVALAQQGALADWQVLHLAGAGHDELVRSAYREAGVRAVVLAFVERMGVAWAAADVAISRSGAGSVAEVLANRVPTIFLPYPYHKDEHQKLNAVPLESAGGAVIVRDAIEPQANASQLAPLLSDFLAHPAKLAQMRSSLGALARPDGAARIARMLIDGI